MLYSLWANLYFWAHLSPWFNLTLTCELVWGLILKNSPWNFRVSFPAVAVSADSMFSRLLPKKFAFVAMFAMCGFLEAIRICFFSFQGAHLSWTFSSLFISNKCSIHDCGALSRALGSGSQGSLLREPLLSFGMDKQVMHLFVFVLCTLRAFPIESYIGGSRI